MPDGPNTKPTIQISDWRPYRRNTLRGFLTVRFPFGLSVRDVTVHSNGTRRWIGMPGKPASA